MFPPSLAQTPRIYQSSSSEANKRTVTTMQMLQPQSTTIGLDAAIDENEAAKFLGFSPRTLQAWRCRGGGPRFIKVLGSRAVRYRWRDLLAFQNENTVTSTSEADMRRA
jgi:hypothetical protein